MNKKSFLLIPVLSLSLGLVIWELSATPLVSKAERLYEKIKIFTSIVETIQRVYLEQKDPALLIDDAIDGMLANLDPHTTYLTPEEFTSWNQNFEGYSGIGISFEVVEGRAIVMSVMELGPAERAGIRSGDELLEIDGIPTLGLPAERISLQLKGSVGSVVAVKIKNERWVAPKELRMTRDKILLHSVPHALMLAEEVGYIKIERFTANTSSEVDLALDRLRELGMKKLVLDLRGNSGGYLNAAIEIVDKFIPAGQKILSTRGRLHANNQVYYSTSEPTFPLWPLIVLIDHGSASASEIVAGAIQDLDRGLLIGKTSFGKGLVQSQYRFQDGSAFLITTAQYYTPSGRAIQRSYTKKNREQYYRDGYEHGTRLSAQSDSYRTLSGREVHGGGGICPDIVVENVETHLSEDVRYLLFDSNRYFHAFCQKALKPHIATISEIEFLRNFIITDRVYLDFIRYIKHSNPEFEAITFTGDKADIKFLLKRELAYLVWGSEARFHINLERDEELREALRHFSLAESLLLSAEYPTSLSRQVILKN